MAKAIAMVHIRYSQVDITPLIPLELAGFAFRKGNYKRIGEKITLSCMIFESRYIFLTIDCLWWGDAVCDEIKKQLKQRFSHKAFDIIFHATHSHSSPQLQQGLSPDLGKVCDAYLTFLTDKSLQAIKQALLHDGQNCQISTLVAECDFAIYRRKKDENNHIIMAPDPYYPIDQSVRITIFHQNKDIVAIWLHFQCHPTMTGDNILSGDYPAVIRRYLQQQYPQAFIQVLQGFCADIRPHFDEDSQGFVRLSYEQMQQKSQNFAKKLYRNIKEQHWKDLNSDFCLSMRHQEFLLPLEKIYSAEELHHIRQLNRSKIIGEWAEYFLNHPQRKKNDLNLSLSFFQIHKELSLLAVNGEVSNEYAQKLCKKYPYLLPLGYSNGMIGYIPTATQLNEGGYEAEDFIYYFRVPAKFSPCAPALLYQYFYQMIEGE